MRQFVRLLAPLILLAACSPAPTKAPEGPADQAREPYPSAQETWPAVDPVLLAATNDQFTAIEPSEVGVQGAPNVQDALWSLLSPSAYEEGGDLHMSMREEGDATIADVVRTGFADDSVSAAQVRVEFRREAEGWFPTNAYRRQQCRRGANAGQWSAAPCP